MQIAARNYTRRKTRSNQYCRLILKMYHPWLWITLTKYQPSNQMITQKKKIKKGERARKYIVESSVKKNIKKKIRKEEGAVNRNGWIGREKEI
jgi:hypothetical protein